MWLVAFFACFSLVFGFTNFAEEYAPIVHTNSGPVRGVVVEASGRKVNVYHAIRFGQIEKRFELAQPAKPWTDVYNATHWREACPQPFVMQIGDKSTDKMSEDCLYLTVYQPINSNSTSNKKPVMAWIYGGGFVIGTIFSSMYDAQHLAALGDVIIVEINYRVNAFGFLYDGTSDAPGNQGLQDQILGLKWIQGNIAHFGGDPNQVTIFGESAGGMSVGALVLSPLANGLFHRAILQSGSPNSVVTLPTEVAIERTHTLARGVNCTQSNLTQIVACLRTKPMQTLVNASATLTIFPIEGDRVMPTTPVKALKKGLFNHVDLMYGVTRNEGTEFLLMEFNDKPRNLTLNQTKDYIRQHLFGLSFTEQVVEYYTRNLTDHSTQQEMIDAMSDAYGEFILICPTMLFGEEAVRVMNFSQQSYAYRLMQPQAIDDKFKWLGVPHGTDLYFLFGHPLSEQNSTETNLKLSREMISAWANFARSGNPGKVGGVQWDKATDSRDHSSPQVMLLEAGHFRMASNVFRERCDQFWRPKIFE